MKTTGTEPNITILYEDNHLLAVNKPRGVLSQEDHTGQNDLLNLCKVYLKREYNKPGNVYLGLLHRLDKPVSGVMLFAKTSKAASRISEQIRNRSIKKGYLAVVGGNPEGRHFLSHYLAKDRQKNISSVVSKNSRDAKKAELMFTVQQQSDSLSLVSVALLTGRPHQIRVQLSHSGYPIFGDQKYGSHFTGNIALHANRLEFMHPTLKKEIKIEAPRPDEYPWNLF